MTPEREEIIEKYYPHTSDGTAVGFKSERVIKVSRENGKSSCAFEFADKDIYEIDCARYLDYKVGDFVYIKTEGNKITEIRRKR